MFRRLFLTVTLAVAMMPPAQALAQEAGGSRIALVSVQDVVSRTQEGQKRTQELREKFQPEENKIKAKQAEIQSLQNQLAEGANVMSDDAKRKLQRDIETKGREAQRAVEDAEATFQKEVQAFQQDVYNKARTIIHDHMLAKGYSLILDISNPQSPIVDAKTELLITNEIIEAYDQKHPATGAAAAPSQD